MMFVQKVLMPPVEIWGTNYHPEDGYMINRSATISGARMDGDDNEID